LFSSNSFCWFLIIGKLSVKTYLVYSRKERASKKEYCRVFLKKMKEPRKKEFCRIFFKKMKELRHIAIY
jgi:hypothetical protein